MKLRDGRESEAKPAGQGEKARLSMSSNGIVPSRAGVRELAGRGLRGENSALLIVAFLVTLGVFGVLLRNTAFLSLTNLESIVETTTTITIMAVATVFVLSAGELDLSFAAVPPVAGYVAALLLNDGIVLAVACALLSGVLVGAVNGLVTVTLRVPSFVVSLGMMGVLQGLAAWMTNSSTLIVTNHTYLAIFGQGHVASVSVLVIWTIGAVVVGFIVLNFTGLGRRVLATGASPAAARYSGIRVGRIKLGVLIASSVAGALAGLLYVGQFTAATYTLGSTDLLTVLAAVIISGTALSGGRGSVIGALIGSLLLGVLDNALVIYGLSSPEVLVVRGAIIVLAVIFSSRGAMRGR